MKIDSESERERERYLQDNAFSHWKKVGAGFLWRETETRELAFASMALPLFIYLFTVLLVVL
jgi:hypothetical protein